MLYRDRISSHVKHMKQTISKEHHCQISQEHNKFYRGMTLISIEGLEALSQKTRRLLGGVAQILIYLRLSTCPADVELFVRPKSEQFPLEQRVSLQAQLSSHWKIKYSIEIQLFTAWSRHARPLQRSITVKFLESPILALQGSTAPFCTIGMISSIASFAPFGDRHH